MNATLANAGLMNERIDAVRKPVVFCALIFLAGCATPLTEAELAALDYGACPRTHEAKIKEYFQDTLLTAYAGEPIIWPPQKYWYKETPVDGGRLLVGYLVPVRANQTRGNPQTSGPQIYGFLFNDDEVVKTFSPMRMRLLNLREGVGPLPKDARDWKVGHQDRRGNHMIVEWVLPGETAQGWSELISLETLQNYPLDLTPAAMFRSSAELKRKTCTDVSDKVVAQSQIDLVYELKMTNCAPMRDEHLIGKVVLGPRSFMHVWYAKNTPMSEAETQKWTEIVAKAKIFDDCAAQ